MDMKSCTRLNHIWYVWNIFSKGMIILYMDVRFVKTNTIKTNYSFTNAVINIFARIVFMNIIYNIYQNRALWITALLAHVVIKIFVPQKFQDTCFVATFPILKFLHCRVMTTIKKIQLKFERFILYQSSH